MEELLIGIIGAADGPTSIFVATRFAKDYIGLISVAAYSFMALVPLIQPPVITALTTRQERMIKMTAVDPAIPKSLRISFPIIVTLLLGITIGSSMGAEKFLNATTLMILAMGLGAFIFDTAGGALFAKLLNLFRKAKFNPMIGAAGISAFPMSARVIQKLATKEDPNTFIIMQAAGANVSGQLGSVVAGGIVLVLVPVLVG